MNYLQDAEPTSNAEDNWKVVSIDAFRFEQLNMLYRQMSFILLADVVTAIFLFLIFWFTTPSPLSQLWLGTLLLVTTMRAFFINHHRRNYASPEHNSRRRGFAILGASISGIIWGSAFLVLPAEPEFLPVSIVGLWIAGLLAGAATTMAVIKEVFFAFAIPAAALFLSFLALETPDYLVTLGGGFTLYLAFIIPIAMHIGNDFSVSITLKLQNGNLQDKLKIDSLRMQEKEEELMLERRKQAALQSQKAHIDAKLKSADEDRLLLLDAVQEGIYGVNNSGNITFINQSALKFLNFSDHEVIGLSAESLISPTDRRLEKIADANNSITKCYLQGVSAQAVESRFKGKDGLSLPVRFSCQPIRKQNSVIGAVVSFVDISKQKEMEFMLIQSQKMEAIGRLTGGVSHDFNNLLTVIMGNLQFLMKHLREDEQSTKLLNKIMNASKNGAELNNRLLSFSREQALETSPTDIREMLFEMAEFLDRILGEEIELELNLMDEECVVLTDRTQLENAILNLCVNAKDAMPQGGKLTITARLARHALSFIGQEPSDKEGDYIELEVTDTGTGIPESIQKQIFEPFFTTKEKNAGTGLGLSTVYGFLHQSGGNISVSSRMGEGTTFLLYLPFSADSSPMARALPEISTNNEVYEGTILVVEDNHSVRDVACQMLINAGYSVISAENGPEGLKLFRENPDVDLVFSDVIMPGGMTGIEMAEEILKLSPDKPILLTTGYTEKSLMDRILEFKNIICVAKPYDTNELPKFAQSMIKGGNVDIGAVKK